MPLQSALNDDSRYCMTGSELADFEQLVRMAVSIFGIRSGNNSFCSFGLASFYATFSADRVIMLYHLTEKRPSADVGSLAILAYFRGLPTLLQAFETTLAHMTDHHHVEADGFSGDEDFSESVPYRWKNRH